MLEQLSFLIYILVDRFFFFWLSWMFLLTVNIVSSLNLCHWLEYYNLATHNIYVFLTS